MLAARVGAVAAAAEGRASSAALSMISADECRLSAVTCHRSDRGATASTAPRGRLSHEPSRDGAET